jgi:competence protein ComEC
LAANLIEELIIAPALSFGLTAALVGAFVPDLGKLLLIPGEVFSWCVIETAVFFSGLPHSTVRIPHLSVLNFFVCTVAVILTLWLIRTPSLKKLKIYIAGCMGLVLISAAGWLLGQDKKLLSVVFLNVGKGDCIFIRAPNSGCFIIDGGIASPYFDSGISIVNPFLNWVGCRKLDGIIVTHPEMDHMGGLPAIIRHAPPAGVWWNPVPVASKHLEEIFSTARAAGGRVLPADRSRSPISMGDGTLRFLNQRAMVQEKPTHKDLNNTCVVCRLDYSEISFLFCGDLETEGETELLNSRLPVAATVLKVGHHGGRNGSTAAFLRAVRPRIAIISAEYPAARNLPHPEVLERLSAMGTEIYWTGRDGALTLNTDGRTLSVKNGRPISNPKNSVRNPGKPAS